MCDQMKELILYVDFNSQQYTAPQKLNISELCNGITIKNNGNIICLVDDEPIQPGDFKAFGLNRGEVFTGRHNIAFTTAGMAVIPPVQIPTAWVTQKFYIDPPAHAKKTLP